MEQPNWKQLLKLCSSEGESLDHLEFMKLLRATSASSIDNVDEDGMTLLMHCAYLGHVEACQELLARDADVNMQQLKDGYTALMFAALAGKCEVVELLLRAGARTDIQNKLGKMAANVAAFVGQHECAQVISNFFTFSELEQYSKPCPPSQKPRLSPALVTPLHSLLVSTHLHPIKVLLDLQKEPAILDGFSDVQNVLESIGLQLINEQREGLSLKIHYLSYIIRLAHDHGTDRVIGRMLTFSEAGKPVEMDLLLRQCLKEFPYHQIALLKQLVSSLAKTPPGDHPTAYILFISVILGDKGAVAALESCYTCGRHGPDLLKKCSRCKKAWYCCVECQQLAWCKGNHKKLCKQWTKSST